MTAVGWVAVAAAVLLAGSPRVAGVRADLLADGGRLAGSALLSSAPSVTARSALVVSVGCAAGLIAVVLVAGGPLLAVAVAAVLGALVVGALDRHRHRAATARRRDLLTAVRVLVGELEAGSQPAAALAAAGQAGPRVGPVFAAAAQAARRGADAAAVLSGSPRRDVQVIGSAWRLGEATGAALADVLARVAADLAALDEQRRAVGVALSGPQSSATVLAGLPALGIALGAAMGARPLPFLLGPGVGRALCCAGVLLDVGGVLWMRRILRRARRL